MGKPKCIECGVTEDDVLYFAPHMDRPRPVKLVKSRYGFLCQRCVRNAYARQMTLRKHSARETRKREEAKAAGQLDMFGE